MSFWGNFTEIRG